MRVSILFETIGYVTNMKLVKNIKQLCWELKQVQWLNVAVYIVAGTLGIAIAIAIAVAVKVAVVAGSAYVLMKIAGW